MSERRSDPESTADAERAAWGQLQFYTLAHGAPAFIHQHVVDAWTAQHADARTKPIGLTFALVGLHLHLERGFDGRQVQRVHMQLARDRRAWPSFALPVERGAVTATTVIAAPAGAERDQAIERWCQCVWRCYRGSRDAVAALLQQYGIG